MSYTEIIYILKKNWKLLFRLSVFVTIFIFLILLFIFPVTYSSNLKILPPEENKYSTLNNLLGYSDITGLTNYSLIQGNSQLFAEILKSRTAAEYVVQECGLISYFDADNKYIASERLKNHLDITVSKEGIINLDVNISTPLFGRFSNSNQQVKELSAKIANSFADALDNINYEMLNTRVRKSREYIESQLIKTKLLLDTAESALRVFQEKNKTVSLPQQLSAAIETASKLKSEMILTEIQMGTLNTNMKEDNMIVPHLQKRLDELKNQYSMIENGNNPTKDFLPSFKEVPRLEQQLARLVREVEIQNEVYLLLQKQYYMEKIYENRNLPTVAVLDKAIIPIKAANPRLVFHTGLAGLTSFFILSLIFVLLENKKYNKKRVYQEEVCTSLQQ